MTTNESPNGSIRWEWLRLMAFAMERRRGCCRGVIAGDRLGGHSLALVATGSERGRHACGWQADPTGSSALQDGPMFVLRTLVLDRFRKSLRRV